MIAPVMAVDIINFLEMVQIQHHGRKRLPIFVNGMDGLIQELLGRPAIIKARQTVMACQEGQLPVRFFQLSGGFRNEGSQALEGRGMIIQHRLHSRCLFRFPVGNIGFIFRESHRHSRDIHGMGVAFLPHDFTHGIASGRVMGPVVAGQDTVDIFL